MFSTIPYDPLTPRRPGSRGDSRELGLIELGQWDVGTSSRQTPVRTARLAAEVPIGETARGSLKSLEKPSRHGASELAPRPLGRPDVSLSHFD